jgi:hypothetical protein
MIRSMRIPSVTDSAMTANLKIASTKIMSRKIKMASGITFILATAILTSQAAFAFSLDCKVPPSRLNEKASLMVRNHATANPPASLPDTQTFPLRIDGFGEDSNGNVKVVHEAFYRPRENSALPLLHFPIIESQNSSTISQKIPALNVNLTRERNVVYVCGRADTGKGIQELTIYFLRGYHLDPAGWWDIFENSKSPQLKVSPETVSVIDVDQFQDEVLGPIKSIPGLGPILDIPALPFRVIQRIQEVVLGEFAGVGVERIVITKSYFELANGVDLNNPTRPPRLSKRFEFKSAARN